jgi:ABC-type polysaccharide/polyol phosphate transport system ATPase subunit
VTLTRVILAIGGAVAQRVVWAADVGLEVRRGAGLIGRNGAGKTTLLKFCRVSPGRPPAGRNSRAGGPAEVNTASTVNFPGAKHYFSGSILGMSGEIDRKFDEIGLRQSINLLISVKHSSGCMGAWLSR